MLPGSEGDPREAAGAFSVTKSAAGDRLIGDCRPRNAMERQARPPLLPFGPRILRMRLLHDEGLHAQTRDLRHCFYLWGVSAPRYKQMVGPRIPVAWLEDLNNEAEDHSSRLRGSWWRGDLYGDRRRSWRQPLERRKWRRRRGGGKAPPGRLDAAIEGPA